LRQPLTQGHDVNDLPILLVDDGREMRDSLASYLAKNGLRMTMRKLID